MPKLRVRDLFTHSPLLDEVRTSFLANVCTTGINFFDRSYPITRIITEAARQYLEEKRPVIFTIYHGQIIGMLHIVEDRSKITILISRSRDGEMIARIAENIGLSVARGSPAFAPIEGTRQLLAAARDGQSLMLTVDGPRGPIYQVKTGVIRIAEMTGLPLLPFYCRFKKSHTMRKSWDKMMGGYFGTPALYVIGEPIIVPKDLTDDDLEKYRKKLEDEMRALKTQADEYTFS